MGEHHSGTISRLLFIALFLSYICQLKKEVLEFLVANHCGISSEILCPHFTEGLYSVFKMWVWFSVVFFFWHGRKIMTSRSPVLHCEQLRWKQRKCSRVAVHAGEMPLGCVIGSVCVGGGRRHSPPVGQPCPASSMLLIKIIKYN